MYVILLNKNRNVAQHIISPATTKEQTCESISILYICTPNETCNTISEAL